MCTVGVVGEQFLRLKIESFGVVFIATGSKMLAKAEDELVAGRGRYLNESLDFLTLGYEGGYELSRYNRHPVRRQLVQGH